MKIKLGLGKLNIEDVTEWCGGELYNFSRDADCEFEYVCTDSREADDKTLFFATRGERVDGHDYIKNAIELGCRCILCEYVPMSAVGYSVAFVTVENSIEAFSTLAKGYRSQKPVTSVAITGSVGKTTTKELTSSILKNFLNLYSTVGNFNSVIGMPMSLMECPSDKDAAVFEMGMSGFGEISRMTNTACPRVAMVTNIGSSHLEYLKTRENIAKAKLEIAEGIVNGGYLLLNGDEPLLRSVHDFDKNINIIYVGIDNKNSCDVNACNIRIDDSGTTFDLSFRGRTYTDLKIKLIGRHYVYNASFAAIAGLLLGAREENVRKGLFDYTPEGMRQNITNKNGIVVIEDCYNAAPESMRGALDTLEAIKSSGKKIAVLGDMRELGENSDEMHREIGRCVASKSVDVLLTLGRSGALIAEGAITCGMDPACVFAQLDEDDLDEMKTEILGRINTGDVILFKASRALMLERLIEKLF